MDEATFVATPTDITLDENPELWEQLCDLEYDQRAYEELFEKTGVSPEASTIKFKIIAVITYPA